MNDKTILLECKDCGEVFLGDNLCDGYMCPIESVIVVGFGKERNITINTIEENIKAREKGLEEDKNTIARAKKNGLIRTYNKRKGEDNLIGGADYSSEGDKTSISINTSINTTEVEEKLNKVEEQIDRINDKVATSTELATVKEMAEIIKDAMRMLIYKE